MNPKLVTLTAALVLAGCAATPAYRKPQLDLPAAFKEAGTEWRPAAPADAADRGPWWQAYHDDVLTSLVERSLRANTTIAGAESQLRSARTLVAQAGAAAWPTVGLSASATRSHEAAGNSLRGGGTGNSLAAGLQASWEPDLWGRVGAQVAQARRNAEASAADLRSAQLAVQVGVVQTYLALRQADAQRALLARLVDDADQSLKLTRNRVNAGVASASDVAQAEAQLETVRAQAIDLQSQRAADEHALAVLAGEAPARFAIAPATAQSQALPAPPGALPSDLLERRPDIAGAERRLAAANAAIGIARAAYFPSITLGASIGSQAASLASLFSAPAAVWSFGPALAAALLDGGARAARTDQARADYDTALATYRGAVLTAMQEVEDALAAQRVLADEAAVQQRALAAAERSLQLVGNQYRAGTVSYGDVVTARSNAITASRTLLALQGNRLQASVALVKALGGDSGSGA